MAVNSSCLARTLAVAALLAGSSVASAGEWSLSLTPRVALNFLSVGSQLDTKSADTDAETLAIPTAGLTIGASNTDWGGTQLLFSVLYGEGSGDFTAVANSNPGTTTGPGFVAAQGELDAESLDLEILVVRPLGSTGTYWTGGVQYRKLNQDFEITSGPPIFGGQVNASSETDIWLAKAGIGAVVPLRGLESQRLFGNFILGGGTVNIKSGGEDDHGGILGIDLNLGWQYLMSERTSLALRYRAQIARLFSIRDNRDDSVYVHGPELNLTFRF